MLAVVLAKSKSKTQPWYGVEKAKPTGGGASQLALRSHSRRTAGFSSATSVDSRGTFWCCCCNKPPFLECFNLCGRLKASNHPQFPHRSSDLGLVQVLFSQSALKTILRTQNSCPISLFWLKHNWCVLSYNTHTRGFVLYYNSVLVSFAHHESRVEPTAAQQDRQIPPVSI